ncbi:hypothetical protein ACP4OV_012921 [Aristida adscensionis]
MRRKRPREIYIPLIPRAMAAENRRKRRCLLDQRTS